MNSTEGLLKSIAEMTAGMFYISETDAELQGFTAGASTGEIKDHLVNYAAVESGTKVQAVVFDSFFAKLAARHDWQTPAQIDRSEKFRALGEFLKSELREPIVVRVGDIRVDIFVAGIDGEGNVSGVRTFAVET